MGIAELEAGAREARRVRAEAERERQAAENCRLNREWACCRRAFCLAYPELAEYAGRHRPCGFADADRDVNKIGSAVTLTVPGREPFRAWMRHDGGDWYATGLFSVPTAFQMDDGEPVQLRAATVESPGEALLLAMEAVRERRLCESRAKARAERNAAPDCWTRLAEIIRECMVSVVDEERYATVED